MFLIGLAPVALGCGRSDEPAAPIRLVDELGTARIESPLQGLDPWESVRDGLVDEEFWQARLVAGRRVSRDCRATSASEFECRAPQGERYAAAFKVPTESHGHYRIEARVRSSGRTCSQMRISDLRETRVLRVAEQANEWQEMSEMWHTGGGDDTLRIAFRGGCPVAVDSLRVRRLLVSRPEELSLLAAQAVSPFAGESTGLVKYGSLLPHRDAETVAGPFDENWGFREAILAPAPTDISYFLTVPRKASLRFSYALSEMSRIGDRTRFEVLAGRPGDEPRAIWSEELTLTAESWHWREAVVDLAALGGQEVELTLRTRSPGERGYAIWGTPTIDQPRRPGDPPNIVLIAVDTLRADRLSGYGYDKATSPNLDALARDGSLFLYPISQSTQTPPSFASLFTGQIVARHGFLFATSKLAPNVPTLARVLRQNGWTTHAAIFHAALYDLSLARGFERYFNMPRTKHRADQNLQKGLDFLAANGDRRFFFFLHFSDPHQPFTHPPSFIQEETAASLAELGVELPFNVRGSIGDCEPCKAEGGLPEEFRGLVRDLYDEEIAYVDDQIGVFLQELRDRGLYDDTIIVFTSDHGETLWDHYDFFDHGGFNQHDELTRVPLIVKPAKGTGFAENAVVRTQVRSFDLMPTVLEMAGIDTTLLGTDAQSLVPLLRADSSVPREDIWSFTNNEQAASVRGRGWKWTWAARASAGERLEGLYDLTDDPGENRNVADRHPQVLRGMRGRYMETLLESGGGRYLLLLGDGAPAGYRVEVRTPGVGWWRQNLIDSLGLMRTGSPEPGASIYEGAPLLDGLVLFAKLPPSEEAPVVRIGRIDAAGGPPATEPADLRRVAYEPGAISSLLAAGEPGGYLIEGEARLTGATEEGVERLDATQEEALRALGYIQ